MIDSKLMSSETIKLVEAYFKLLEKKILKQIQENKENIFTLVK